MQIINVRPEQTENGDLTVSFPSGLPIAYCGRGSYIDELKVWTMSSEDETNETMLIYIGRYCSIANNVQIYCDFNHDYKSVYQGLIPEYRNNAEGASVRERNGQNYRFSSRKGMTVIGNDVWIGNDVTIISDVIIGNGAVIGAGSVVTSDIPAYTIWAGNPARQIRERFPKEISARLQDIQWWNFPGNRLAEIREDMQGNVEEFVKKYAADSDKDEKTKNRNDKIIITVFIDASTDYSTFGNVIEEYAFKLADKNTVLNLVYNENLETDKRLLPYLISLIDELKCNSISLVGIGADADREIIRQSDYFVLGRDVDNIERISHAMRYGVRMISGVNIPIFTDSMIREIIKN
ncbi:CatB-related O-acetyltransferase [Lachnospiraceae bacterium C1.1]|nr:CatB-related O-acetyltransferase [Lachnospiraceae bacterium C1.1]